MSEFEDRDTGLSELAEDISFERGELWNSQDDSDMGYPPPLEDSNFSDPVNVPMGGRESVTPLDINIEAKRNNPYIQSGTDSFMGMVDSVFDTRPIHSREFVKTEKVPYFYGSSSEPYAEMDYIVPSGYTAILRGFSYRPTLTLIWSGWDLGYGSPLDAVTMSILIDNVPVPDYENMIFGQDITDTIKSGIFPTHILIPPNKKLTLRLSASARYLDQLSLALGMAGQNMQEWYDYQMTMYGNLLLSRGLPTEFEVMSQITGRNQQGIK